MGRAMNRKIVLFIAAVIGIVCFSPNAYAHVLLKDQIQGVGAILHINPDDDPIAGESASLFFDIQDARLAEKSSSAHLTVTSDQNETTTVSSTLTGSAVSANYTFPRQGLYKIKLVITQDGKVTHTFLQGQRVGRGIMGDVNTTSVPAWTQMGIVGTVVAAALVLIIAFNRRKDINNYSKF